MTAIPVILTRPEAASARFAARLSAKFGARVRLILSPLLQIVPLDVSVETSGLGGLILTSANGVAAAARLPFAPGLPAYCVGTATTAAARAAGFDAQNCGPEADTLVTTLITRAPTGPLLHLRGRHARGDVAARLCAAGQQVNDRVAYDQVAMSFTPEALSAITSGCPVILPVFSPRTAQVISDQLSVARGLLISALSAANAEPLRRLGARQLDVAASPDADAMLALIETHLNQAARVEGAEDAE